MWIFWPVAALMALAMMPELAGAADDVGRCGRNCRH